jgi:UDP-N-acetyl-D-mannosaminuronic acid dehydrogenase
MQLGAFARNQFALGHAALLINEGLVLHVVDDLRQRYDLTNSTVGLLGMAFKADSDDTRASLSYKFKKILSVQTRAVLTTDPFVTRDPELRPLDQSDCQQRSHDSLCTAYGLSRCRLPGQAGI